LNTQLPAPEILVYGRKGHGKSAVLESLIGFPFNLVGKDADILFSMFLF
jgi:hypothetical protein